MADDPELENVRNEVAEEMLQIAREREKSYDSTIDLVKARLETEQNEFRVDVYRQILEDTLHLKEINKHTLEQFEKKQASGGGAEPEPSKANQRPAAERN